MMLSILAIAIYLFILGLIVYRMLKIRFTKYNKENIGLLCISTVFSYSVIEPEFMSLLFTYLSTMMLLMYVTLWLRSRRNY